MKPRRMLSALALLTTAVAAVGCSAAPSEDVSASEGAVTTKDGVEMHLLLKGTGADSAVQALSLATVAGEDKLTWVRSLGGTRQVTTFIEKNDRISTARLEQVNPKATELVTALDRYATPQVNVAFYTTGEKLFRQNLPDADGRVAGPDKESVVATGKDIVGLAVAKDAAGDDILYWADRETGDIFLMGLKDIKGHTDAQRGVQTAPTRIANVRSTGFNFPSRIVPHLGFLYLWAELPGDGAALLRVDPRLRSQDGGAPVVRMGGAARPSDLVSTGDDLYWMQDSAAYDSRPSFAGAVLYHMVETRNGPMGQPLVDLGESVSHLAADADFVYLAFNRVAGDGPWSTIRMVSPRTAQMAEPTTLQSSANLEGVRCAASAMKVQKKRLYLGCENGSVGFLVRVAPAGVRSQ